MHILAGNIYDNLLIIEAIRLETQPKLNHFRGENKSKRYQIHGPDLYQSQNSETLKSSKTKHTKPKAEVSKPKISKPKIKKVKTLKHKKPKNPENKNINVWKPKTKSQKATHLISLSFNHLRIINKLLAQME